MCAQQKNNESLKILLFKIGALGDTLMTTPFLRQLRSNFPLARIDYLIGNTSSVVLAGNKYLDNIIKFDEHIFFKKKPWKLLALVKKIRREKYDIIFVLDKHRVFNITGRFFGIKERIGFDRDRREGNFLTQKIRYGNEKHEIYYYLDLLNGLKIRPDYNDFKMDLFLEKKDDDFAKAFWRSHGLNKKKVIGIAPGGGKNSGEKTEYRNWPITNYIQLIKLLLKRNYFIILLGGPDDKEKENEIMKTFSNNILNKVNNYADDSDAVNSNTFNSNSINNNINNFNNNGASNNISNNAVSNNINNNVNKIKIISKDENKNRGDGTLNGYLISLIGKCSIKESTAIMKKCDNIICNDSGVMHLAATVNKKTISLFGPTNPVRKSPLWKQSKSIWKDNDIYDPDYELYGKIDKNKLGKFMKRIKPEDVVKLI